jgi:hypothetical protein
MTIPSSNRYILFALLLFYIPIFSQQKLLLEAHLKAIETHFGVVFNYESGLVADTVCDTCVLDKTERLSAHISYLENEFKLDFTFVTATKIVISIKKNKTLLFIDFDDNTPVSGVLVTNIVSNKRRISQVDGRIKFEKNAPKNITISHLNYGKKSVFIDSLKGNTVYLHKKDHTLDELFLYTYFTNGTYKKKDGNFFIKPNKISHLAGLTSHDVIKSLENLPQVVSNSESISDLIIRGGTQDQNLFLWNGIRVYQNHHFFGLISAFNENLISTINLYDNATPAKYGNSTSGVISLEHETKISKKIKGGFGANFLSVDAYAKIPFSEKSELQLSGRKSLTQTWKSPTYLKYSKKIFQSSLVNTTTPISNDDIMSDDSFEFYDIQVQYSYKPNATNTFNINGIYLKNNLSYIEEDVLNIKSKKSDLEQENLAFGTNWKHTFLNRGKLLTAISYSKHSMYGGNFLLSKDIASIELNNIESFESRLQYSSKLYASGFNHAFGVSYDYLTIKNNTTNFNSLFISNLTQRSAIYNVFGTLNYQTENMSMGIDLRHSYYTFLKSFQIEPRFHFTYALLPKFDIQIRSERKTQNISQVIDLENNFLGIEKRRWSMANNSLAPIQESDQLELALILKTSKNTFNLSIYNKQVSGITTNNQGFQNLNQFENFFGKYTVKGVQGHYNFKSKHVNAWLSYNYSVNKYKFKDLYPAVFYNNNDIRNSIITGVNLKYNAFNFSTGMEYNSGKPFTSINDEMPIIEDVFNTINYNEPNDKRMSDYLRFDATISYQFKVSKKATYKLAFGMINIGNRKNILSRYYTLTEDKNAIEVLDKYGLEFTPNLSLNIDF